MAAEASPPDVATKTLMHLLLFCDADGGTLHALEARHWPGWHGGTAPARLAWRHGTGPAGLEARHWPGWRGARVHRSEYRDFRATSAHCTLSTVREYSPILSE